MQIGTQLNGDSICITAAELLGDANLSCPTGSVLAGINPDGTLNCLANSDIAPPPTATEIKIMHFLNNMSTAPDCEEGWQDGGCAQLDSVNCEGDYGGCYQCSRRICYR